MHHPWTRSPSVRRSSRVTDAHRIAPPPTTTGILALFIPPREIGDRTSRRAVSLPPRPSRASISPAYASTLVHTPATTGTSVVRAVRPSLRLRRARAASTAALNALAPRPPPFVGAKRAESIFEPRPGSTLRASKQKATTPTRRFPLPALLVPLASPAVVSRPRRHRPSFGSSSGARFLPVRRPQSPTRSRATRPQTRRGGTTRVATGIITSRARVAVATSLWKTTPGESGTAPANEPEPQDTSRRAGMRSPRGRVCARARRKVAAAAGYRITRTHHESTKNKLRRHTRVLLDSQNQSHSLITHQSAKKVMRSMKIDPRTKTFPKPARIESRLGERSCADHTRNSMVCDSRFCAREQRIVLNADGQSDRSSAAQERATDA